MTGAVVKLSQELNRLLAPQVVAVKPIGLAPDASKIKPGVYRRGELEALCGYTYRQLPAVNFSSLKFMDISAKHYRHAVQCGAKQTRPMFLGVVRHTAVLEPEMFASEFVIWEDKWSLKHAAIDPESGDPLFDGVDEIRVEVPGKKPQPKKVGSSRVQNGGVWSAFKERHASKTIVSQGDFDDAVNLATEVRKNPYMMRYLAVGEPEVSFVWVDELTGLLCKGRVDWMGRLEGRTHLSDLKGTVDIREKIFGAQCARMLYPGQQAFYHDGYQLLTGEDAQVNVLAVENNQPHDGRPFEMGEDELAVGRDMYRPWLSELAQCLERDEWPGQAKPGPTPRLVLPQRFYRDENENDLSELGLTG